MLAFMTIGRHPPSARPKDLRARVAAHLVCGDENKGRAMQGDQRVIEYLNKALRHELTAVNQYWLHYRILDNWGFKDLAKTWRKESIEEMEHADLLIARILFLEGHPSMQPSDGLRIGQDLKNMLECDLAAEVGARTLYLEAARHCELGERSRLQERLREADGGRGAPHRLPRDPARAHPPDRRRALRAEAYGRAGRVGAGGRASAARCEISVGIASPASIPVAIGLTRNRSRADRPILDRQSRHVGEIRRVRGDEHAAGRQAHARRSDDRSRQLFDAADLREDVAVDLRRRGVERQDRNRPAKASPAAPCLSAVNCGCR